MKQLKKMIVLAVLAVVMTVMSGTDAKAGQINTTEPVVWGKSYVTTDDRGETFYEYSLKLTTSGRVTIAMNAETSGLYSGMELYDASKQKIWVSGLPKGMNTYNVDLLAGDYTFRVCDTTTSWIPNFVPSGETSPEYYMNNNNQLGLASSYAVGSTVKAQFALNDNTDIYQVKINKAGYLNMKYSSTVTKFDMQLVSANGDISYKEYNIPLGASSYKYFVPKGTYYISFERGGKEYTGTYTFSTKLSGLTTSKVRAAKNVSGKKAKITWAKKSDVDGYQVQVATNKKFSQNRKSKEISGQNASNYTFTKLKKGKTYYARVRTYKLANGKKVYSDWSAAKAVKIRK